MLQRLKPSEVGAYRMSRWLKPSEAGPYPMLQRNKPSEVELISCCSGTSLQKLGGSHAAAEQAFRSWADLMLTRKMSKEAVRYPMLQQNKPSEAGPMRCCR